MFQNLNINILSLTILTCPCNVKPLAPFFHKHILWFALGESIALFAQIINVGTSKNRLNASVQTSNCNLCFEDNLNGNLQFFVSNSHLMAMKKAQYILGNELNENRM